MNTISEVLAKLETIISWAKENDSPAGYFAVVYFEMTKAVQTGVLTGLFEDGPRMERLDVIFAQRYFDAFEAWQAGQPTTRSWEIAFTASQNNQLSVLQHILLGINAHIDLDLGIAAAQTQPGPGIETLRTDFERINQVIESLVDPVQDKLAGIFPLFRFLDWILRTFDERFANSIISLGRRSAWGVAKTLAALDESQADPVIRQLDKTVAAIGARIQNPGRLLTPAFRFVRWGERGTVREKIEKLQQKL